MSRQELSPVGKVSYDGALATLVFQRVLPHPPEAVWQALTDAKQLSSWYMMRASVPVGPTVRLRVRVEDRSAPRDA